MRRTATTLALMILASPAAAGEITGKATVTDGDTLDIRGETVRLQGIDAPESGQSCGRAGNRWRCGQRAANALD